MGVKDSAASKSGLLHDAIETAVGALSQAKEFTLTKYTKYTNPADGYVYWLKTEETKTVQGSLHNAADQDQAQDETISRNAIILTAQDAIKGFDEINPAETWLIEIVADDPALVDGGPLLIGFNSADNYYEQAGAYHYLGHALYPQFRAFVVDDPDTFLATIQPANSLPIMLGLADYLGVDLYAAYAVPPNIRGAYISVDIQASKALQAAPAYYEKTVNSVTTSHVEQFMRDEVELIAYNLDQAAAQKLVYLLTVYIPDRYALYGVANSAAVVDKDRVQSEYLLRANKKSVKMSVSYWLSTSQDQLQKSIDAVNYSLTISEGAVD